MSIDNINKVLEDFNQPEDLDIVLEEVEPLPEPDNKSIWPQLITKLFKSEPRYTQ
jgi:hypothetical protein